MGVRQVISAVVVLGFSAVAGAGPFQDPLLAQAYDTGRMPELARLAATQDTPERLAAYGYALALPNDGRSLGLALEATERCIRQHPSAWICHWTHGHALGVKALRGGWMRGLSVLKPLRESLERAVALKPDSFDARSRLQQYFLLVPSVAGGGVDRARALENEPALTPSQQRLLKARVAAKEKRWDAAEATLDGLHRVGDRAFLNEVLDAWSLLLHHWLKSDAYVAARVRLQPLQRDLPELAWPAYALGRIEADAKNHEEALRHYVRASGLSGAAELPLDHRMGLSYEALGQLDAARRHLERFVQDPHATPNAVEDARKHLKQLGSS